MILPQVKILKAIHTNISTENPVWFNELQAFISIANIGQQSKLIKTFFLDINECEAGKSDCMPGQICVNTDGSYECQVECRDGFKYDPRWGLDMSFGDIQGFAFNGKNSSLRSIIS